MNKLNLGKDLYLKGRIGWRGLSKDEYLVHSDYRIINATALMDGYVDWKNCGFISKERYYESDEIMLQEGDLLISKDGTIGKIGYVKNMPSFCTVASGIFVLRNTIPDRLNFDYLYHILKSEIFKNFIHRNKAQGSTIPHLYQRDLINFEIDLPDINEQEKIANLLNNYDLKIENLNKINNEILNHAKRVFDYWFMQFDFDYEGKPYKSNGNKMVWNEELSKDIPLGWEVKKLSEIIGKTPQIQSIKAPDYKMVGKYPIIDQASDYITGRTDEDYCVFDNKDGCVVFGDVTTYFKFVNFSFAKGTDGTKIIFAKDGRIPPLLLYFLIKDAKLPNIGFARHFMYLKEYPVLVPPIELCRKFQEKFDKELSLFRNNISLIYELEKTKNYLLPLLVSGKIKSR